MADNAQTVSFLIQSVLITIPGLLTPGPVMAVTIEHGTRSPHAGAFITLGHGVVELPLVLLLFLGLGKFASEPCVRSILALIGGIFLVYTAWKTFRTRNMAPLSAAKVSGASFTAGIVLTLANPFFLLWWATIGGALIMRSNELGVAVSVLFYALHFISNFIWLYLISYTSYTGHSVLGNRYRHVVSVICGATLFIFGGYFMITAAEILGTLFLQ